MSMKTHVISKRMYTKHLVQYYIHICGSQVHAFYHSVSFSFLTLEACDRQSFTINYGFTKRDFDKHKVGPISDNNVPAHRVPEIEPTTVYLLQSYSKRDKHHRS